MTALQLASIGAAECKDAMLVFDAPMDFVQQLWKLLYLIDHNQRILAFQFPQESRTLHIRSKDI